MSFFTSTIDYLLHRKKPMEHETMKAITRIKAADNPSHLAVIDGEAGSVSKYVQMEADTGMKRTSMNTYQHAVTYMQFQEEAIKYAQILYDEMAKLAQQAVDPMTSDAERAELAEHFEQLRKVALNLNHETYKDAFLFEERASSTDFAEDAEWKLQWASHEGSGGNILSKDVIYSEGKISLRVNSGNRGERYELIQGDPDGDHVVLFDSGNWRTKGEANNYDFDEFIIEWNRDQETFFHSPDSSTGDALDTPKGDATPYWITPTEDAPEVDEASQRDDLGRNLWKGSTFLPEEFSEEDAANNIYQKSDILSYNNQLWLLVEDSESLEAPVAGSANWREITFAGTWNSSGNDAGTIVWDPNGNDAGTIVAHGNNFFMLVEDTGGNITPDINQPEWESVDNELISEFINLRGNFNRSIDYALGDIVTRQTDVWSNRDGYWILTGEPAEFDPQKRWADLPENDSAWLKLSNPQADEMLQYKDFDSTAWTNFLWDGEHSWVQGNGRLKDALRRSDVVNPALHSYEDQYKARLPNPNDTTNEGLNTFDTQERASVFEILDQSGKPILEFTAKDIGASANDYQFEINTNQDLFDEQPAIIFLPNTTDGEVIKLTAKDAWNGFEGNKITLEVDAEDWRYTKIRASGIEFKAADQGDIGNTYEVEIIESQQATANIKGVLVKVNDNIDDGAGNNLLIGTDGNGITGITIDYNEGSTKQAEATLGSLTITANDSLAVGTDGNAIQIEILDNVQSSVGIGGVELEVIDTVAHGEDGDNISIRVLENQSSAASMNLLGVDLTVKETHAIGEDGNNINITVSENQGGVTGIDYNEGTGNLSFENALSSYTQQELVTAFAASTIFDISASNPTLNLTGTSGIKSTGTTGSGSSDITYQLNGSTHEILLPKGAIDYTAANFASTLSAGGTADITGVFEVTTTGTSVAAGDYLTTGGVGTNQISYDAAGHKFYLPQGATEGDFESVNTGGNFTIVSTNDASAVSFRGTKTLSGGTGDGQVNASFDASTKKLTIDLPTTFAAVSNADLRNAINAIPELSATLGGNGAQDTIFSGGIGTDTLTYEESGTTGTINLAGGTLANNSFLAAQNAFISFGSSLFQSVSNQGGALEDGTYTYTSLDSQEGLEDSTAIHNSRSGHNPLLTLRQGKNDVITHQKVIDAFSSGRLEASSTAGDPSTTTFDWPVEFTEDETYYASYRSQGNTITDQDHLNENLGRDEEKVRYSEDTVNKIVTIDLRGDTATPEDIVLAYEAWLNNPDADPDGNLTWHQSSFKTPVILDEAGRNTESIEPKFRIGGISAESSTGSIDNTINDLEIVHNTQAIVDIGGAKITVKPALAHGEDSDNINIEVEYDTYASWTGFYEQIDPSTHKITLPYLTNKYDSRDLVSILENHAGFSANFDIEQSDTALGSSNYTTNGGEGKAPTAHDMHYDEPTKTLWLAQGAQHTNQTLFDYLNGLDASNSFWTDFGIDQGSLAIEGNASQTLESITYTPLARLKMDGRDTGTTDISATSQMDGNRGTAGALLTGKQGQVISKSSNPNMIDSSKLSLRVTPGDPDPEMIDNSFQAVVHYTPPEKLEEKSIGDESEFGGTLLSLGLGLLRFGQEVSDKNLKGQAISIDTYEKALEAINSLARETNDLAKQVNRLGENKSKASMTLDHLGRQFAIRKDLSTHSPDDIIEEEAIRMQEIEILRDYHISLLHKVMRVNEDMVRMLIIK